MTWTNNDGLKVKFGIEEATMAKAVSVPKMGDTEFEVRITLADLTATAGGTVYDDVIIPDNFRIEEVEVFTETAATSGGSAALNVGLVRLDRTTEVDFNGLVEAQAITSHDATGEKTVLRAPVSGTGVGDLVGTTITEPSYFAADYDTAAYTAGVVRIRVKGFFIS